MLHTVSQILSSSGSHDAAKWQFCKTTQVPASTAWRERQKISMVKLDYTIMEAHLELY